MEKKARRTSNRLAFAFVGNIRQPISERFGLAVRNRRKQLEMTHSDLAKLAGLSRPYISEVECGRESISLERAERLAKALNTNLPALLRED
jgi:transcriptional regulator with XRE-family HTH domain